MRILCHYLSNKKVEVVPNGISIIIQADNKTLKKLMEQVVLTIEQQHYLTKLLGFGYSYHL